MMETDLFPRSAADLELLGLLLDEEQPATDAPPGIVRRRDRGWAPLSFAQQRLWFLYRMDPGNPAYNIALGVWLSGVLDVPALQAALSEIIKRHEILRARFGEIDGVSCVEVQTGFEVPLAVADLSTVPADEQQREVERYAAHEAKRPFELSAGPLLRMRLLRLDATKHAAIFVMHHIVSDAWSMAILLRELSTLYSAFVTGGVSPLPELSVQYTDFSQWQHEQGEEGAFRQQTEYWRKQLAAISPLDLLTDRPRPAQLTYQGAYETFTVPQAVGDRLRSLASEERSTLFMALLAAYQALLHRYSSQDDIAVGTPIANRNRPELEPLIGFFVNTLVLRTDFSGQPSFRALLRRVREVALDGYAHQDLPFEKLVQELLPDRDLSHNPLFQVMFSLDEGLPAAFELPGLKMTPLRIDSPAAKFELSVIMENTTSGLVGAIEYNTALFDAGTVVRMARQFTRLLSAFAAFPDLPIASHSLLDAEERSLLLHNWSGAQASSKYLHASMAALFEEQVKCRPEATAVVFEAQTLSYLELDRQAEQLARQLRRRGVGPEVLVGLCAERSLELVIALVAIAKVGGAYVALDPTYPPRQLGLIMQDAGLRLVLTQERLLKRLPDDFGGEVLLLETPLPPKPGAFDKKEPKNSGQAGLDNLAYVSYTSGSTGQPKGVEVLQRGVVRLVKGNWFARMDEREVFLMMAPVCFDASTFEIWGALLNGAKLVVMTPGAISLEQLRNILIKERVTTLWLTAGLFNLLVDEQPEALSGLAQLLAGGDVLSPAHVHRALKLLPGGSRLINGYGPTENTTFSCCHVMDASAGEPLSPVPIGRAVAGTSVYLLNEELEPVPPGIAGELFVGGEGLARAYLGRPELTAERFVPNPFATSHGTRLYRTGDLCRWRADGTIEFLGRKDGQVKVRGYRVELAGIEAALTHLPQVKQAAVVAVDSGGNGMAPGRRLIGYVVPEQLDKVDVEALRRDLQESLPGYMVPAALVVLPALPLNANGKLDRAALPREAPSERQISDEFEAPRNETEALLASIWQQLLQRKHIGIHENYFAVGGDSISALQLVSRLQREGWQLTIREIFECPTIALLAPRLRRRDSREANCAAVEGPVPLSAIQSWFFEHQLGGPHIHHFNQAVALRSRERLEESALREAIKGLQRHHDALRMVYRIGERVEQTACGDDLGIDLTTVELRGKPDAAALLKAHADALQAGICLETGPLIRATLYQLSAHDCLLLTIHHLVTDGMSWRIILEDLETAYQQALAGFRIQLGAKTDSFKDWAKLQIEAAESPELLAQVEYLARRAGKVSDTAAARFPGRRRLLRRLLLGGDQALRAGDGHFTQPNPPRLHDRGQ